MSSALQTLATPAKVEESAIRNPPPSIPRWEPLDTELWLGNIELYNSRLEGYEAIVALEVIEHLEPNLLSRFGVVTMGTYRPKLLLVSTPVSLSVPERSVVCCDGAPGPRTASAGCHTDHQPRGLHRASRISSLVARAQLDHAVALAGLTPLSTGWPLLARSVPGAAILSHFGHSR